MRVIAKWFPELDSWITFMVPTDDQINDWTKQGCILRNATFDAVDGLQYDDSNPTTEEVNAALVMVIGDGGTE